MKEKEFVSDFVNKFKEQFPDAQIAVGMTCGENFVTTSWYAKSFGAIFWMTEVIRDNCKKASVNQVIERDKPKSSTPNED